MTTPAERTTDVTVTRDRVWHAGRIVERGTVLAGLRVKDAEALAAAGIGRVYRPPAR